MPSYDFGNWNGTGNWWEYPYTSHRMDPTENEMKALNISLSTLHQLVDMQSTFKGIKEQISKLRIIHQDEISKDILNKIEKECDKHLPKEDK